MDFHRIRKAAFVTLVAVALLLVGGYFFRLPLARAALHSGNAFFGGGMPYSLSIADTLYRVALRLDPRVEDAWHQRARIAFLGGDFRSAKDMINTQIALHGDSFMASYYIRGLIYGFNKEFAPAEKDFEHFLAWDPNNWAANNDLAWLYFSQGKFNETDIQASRGLLQNPGNPWLLMMRGMARFNLGRREEALTDLSEAREAARLLTEADWSKAYPGNDPRAATLGLSELHATIDKNIALIQLWM